MLLSASESAAAPASPIWFVDSLQRGEEGQGCSRRDWAANKEQEARDLQKLRQRRVALERLRERRGAQVEDLGVTQAAARRGGQGCSWPDRAAGTEQGARDLLERSQRRIALERLRERRGARVADLGVPQAETMREGQGCSWRDRAIGPQQGVLDLLELFKRRVTLERLRERRGARVADLVASQAVAKKRRVRDARGETGPPAQSSARVSYVSDVSVTFLLSASESAATPASPIWLSSRLRRGEEG